MQTTRICCGRKSNCLHKLLIVERYVAPVVTLLVALAALQVGGRNGLFIAVSCAVILVLLGFRLWWDLTGSQKEIQVLNAQLIQSQKLSALGELSAGVAHEINNPLAVITQEVELMEMLLPRARFEQQEDRNDFVECLTEIDRQVERCCRITRGMLDFARKREAVIQETDMNQLIDDMVRLVELEIRNKDIFIERRYAEPAPCVNTDPPLLRQVILNLLNNASQAMGGDGRIIITTCRTEDGGAELRFKDTGPGIAKEHLDKIFNPFFTTKEPGKGTGLGLSICMRIVNELGGTLAVESERGKGAEFIVCLPSLTQSED
ncbi:MAG: ATP-binding protein [Desulfovibrio sp.]|nr:ATP-binding protein [Desulfovibrio sp.]